MAGLPRAVIKTAEDMMTKMQIDYSKDLSANKRKSKVPTPDVPQLSLVLGIKTKLVYTASQFHTFDKIVQFLQSSVVAQ